MLKISDLKEGMKLKCISANLSCLTLNKIYTVMHDGFLYHLDTCAYNKEFHYLGDNIDLSYFEIYSE